MTRLRFFPLIAALTLSACGATTQSTENKTAPAENAAQKTGSDNADNAAAKIVKMNEQLRNVVLIRALLDSHIRCEQVVHSTRIADISGNPAWRAECTGGVFHIITVRPDGMAQVYSPPGQS